MLRTCVFSPLPPLQVRAPMPTKVERLFGDRPGPSHGAVRTMPGYGMSGARSAPPAVNAFSDDSGSNKQQSPHDRGLSDLFKPPTGAWHGAGSEPVPRGAWCTRAQGLHGSLHLVSACRVHCSLGLSAALMSTRRTRPPPEGRCPGALTSCPGSQQR